MPDFRPEQPANPSRGHNNTHRLAWWALALALVFGAMLRSIWIDDMEWKEDERWSYQMSQEVGRARPWPWVGMPTSLGFPNPGLSVWIFVPIGRLVHGPTSMALVVVALNMIGLVGFAAAVRAYLPGSEREPWLWGLALNAVSPFAIRMSRKIWPPSLLTPLLLLLFISHRHRTTRAGALAWGLVGALIGQVHLSAWFVAAGLTVGTVIAELRSWIPRSCHWHWWLTGSAVGAVSAIPWAWSLSRLPVTVPSGPFNQAFIDHLLGYLYGVAATATSVFPFAVLGLGHDARAYEIGPFVGGTPTHVTDLLGFFVLAAIGGRVVMRLIAAIAAPVGRWALGTRAHGSGRLPVGMASATTEAARRATDHLLTRYYLWSTIAIPGVIFLLTTDVYFYHYYFVLCPFLFVLIAECVLPWRRLLLGLVIAQALMSAAYLSYVHQHGGTVRGEYGLTYARQVNR